VIGFLSAIWAPGSGSVSTRAGGKDCGVEVGVVMGMMGVAVGVGVFFEHAWLTRSIAENKKMKTIGLIRDLSVTREERISFSPVRKGRSLPKIL
jgi:hypothetical protein